MCETGGCPVINLNNICTFSGDDENHQVIRNSCFFSPNYSYTQDDVQKYESKSSESCTALNSAEWTAYAQSGQSIYQTALNELIVAGPAVNCDQSHPSTIISGQTVQKGGKNYIGGMFPFGCGGGVSPPPPIQSGNFYGYHGFICERQAYTGDPTICCLQNLYCSYPTDIQTPELNEQNRYNPLCFDTNTPRPGAGTCNLQYRRRVNSDCVDLLSTYCTTGSSLEIAEKWVGSYTFKNGYVSSQGCLRTYFSLLYANQDHITELSGNVPGSECYDSYLKLYEDEDLNMLPTPLVPNARAAQNFLTKAVVNYLENGGDLTISSNISQNSIKTSVPFARMIQKLCKQMPGICESFMFKYCQNFTEADLSKNPNLVQICGCYLSENVNSIYLNTFQINPECTPYCNLPGVIPYPSNVNSFGGKKCGNTVCVINNLNLNFVNSQVNNMKLENVCGNCTSQNGTVSCQCILSDLTFVSVNSQISSLNLAQECGSGLCFQTGVDQNGNKTQTAIPCEQAPTSISFNNQNKSQILSQGLVIAGILILALILLLIIYLIFSPKTNMPGKPDYQYPVSGKYMRRNEFNSIAKVF